MKTFYIIACLLILSLSQQVVYAQQLQLKEESAEDFVKLEMPLGEALTKITFVVTWLSGEGSTEVIFQGENVIRTSDKIELRIPYENDSSRYSSYKILTKYAVETNRYIFVPLDYWGGGSGIFRSLHVVDKKTLRTVEEITLGDRSGIWGLTAADPSTNTIAMTYIRKEDWRGNLTDSIDKAITGHLRMIDGKLRDVAGPRSPIPPDMAFFRAGRFFRMGSDKWEKDAETDEKPQHNVHLDAFYMDKYETTNAQYKEFIDANPQWQKNRIPKKYHDGDYLKHWNGNDYPPDKGNHPVVYVSWYAAMAYAEWRGKRLPTEAEWERAARSSRLWRAINVDTANYGENVGDTTPVGTYPLDASGLYDIAGNVWEWCLDEYTPDFYAISPSHNPLAGGTMDNILSDWRNVKTVRVLRGGSWVSDAKFVRVSDRTRFTPKITNKARGFRCVKAATPKLSQEPDVIFQLVERLQFADGTAVKSIAKDDIDALRDRPMRLGLNNHLDGVTLTNEKDEDIHVRTCREYDSARKRGYYAQTNFDAKMSIWFKHHCGLLNALERAAVPKQRYISDSKVGITHLDLMPFSVFPYASDAEIASGATFQKKIENGELKVVEKKQNALTTEEGIDTGQSLREVVRADFNDDGIEDILLFEYHYAIRGTFGFGGVIVLTRKSVDGKFEVVRPANPAQSSEYPYWFN